MQVEQLLNPILFGTMPVDSMWDDESDSGTPLVEAVAGEFPKGWSSSNNLIASCDSMDSQCEKVFPQSFEFGFLDEGYTTCTNNSSNNININYEFSKFLEFELQQLAAVAPSRTPTKVFPTEDDDIIDLESLPDTDHFDNCASFEDLLLLPGQLDFVPAAITPPAASFIPPPVDPLPDDDDDILHITSDDDIQ